MDVARTRVDELRKSVYVRTKQLLKSTIIKDFGNDRTLRAQLHEYLLRSDILTRLGLLRLVDDLHLTKQDVAHLLRTRDVEFLAREFVDVLLEL